MSLTFSDAYAIRAKVSQWLRIRVQFEDPKKNIYWIIESSVSTETKVKQILMQLAADVDHSALLVRLLEGKAPLPEPPPTQHAYPVYPDDE